MSGWSTSPRRGIPSGRAWIAGTSSPSVPRSSIVLDLDLVEPAFAQRSHGRET